MNIGFLLDKKKRMFCNPEGFGRNTEQNAF